MTFTAYDLLAAAVGAVIAAVVFYSLGWARGRDAEERDWRFASTSEPREIFRHEGMYVVIRREQFWNDWSNPLARARRTMK